jgi:hypothetical protein
MLSVANQSPMRGASPCLRQSQSVPSLRLSDRLWTVSRPGPETDNCVVDYHTE